MMAKKKQEKSKHKEKNLLEWLVFGFSAFLVCGLFVYLIVQIFTYETKPPDLKVSFKPDPLPTAPFQYAVSIENVGHETASDVYVEFVLNEQGDVSETAILKIPMVPQQSKAMGWVNFSINPELTDSLTARVVSYKKP